MLEWEKGENKLKRRRDRPKLKKHFSIVWWPKELNQNHKYKIDILSGRQSPMDRLSNCF